MYKASKKTAWQIEKLRSEQKNAVKQMETENCFSNDDKMQKYMFMLAERNMHQMKNLTKEYGWKKHLFIS